jgi:hypothetical protein
MTTKRISVLESFVTIGSFDCDHTQIELGDIATIRVIQKKICDMQKWIM